MIGWLSLLIGAVLGALASWAITHAYNRRSRRDLRSELDSLKKSLQRTEILDLVKRSDPQADWSRDAAGDVGRNQTFTYRKDVRIHLQMNHDIQCDDFREPWANCFLHPKAIGYYCRLYFQSSMIREFILVAVDGGRGLIPAPTHPDGRIDLLSYRVAQIVGNPNALDQYVAHSGLMVAADSDVS